VISLSLRYVGGKEDFMSETIIDEVRSRYGAVAVSGLSSEHDGVRAVAEAFGYSPEELASIPAEANMGLSCGNPTATARLREGETVVDLGSGGGLDVFLAAAKVGPSGRAIGIDMTAEMIELARRNAAKLEGGAANMEFHQATIDQLPLGDDTVDCVISNCVINLAPDKKAVFREIARVLKPGGRLAVSDIALKRPLPPEVSGDVLAYVGCIAGAITLEEYRQGLVEAGFSEVMIVDSGADLNAYAKVENQSGCGSPAMSETSKLGGQALPIANASACCGASAEGDLHGDLRDLLARYNVNEYAASVKVFAVKPR
jgi:arsenite methyltransferase